MRVMKQYAMFCGIFDAMNLLKHSVSNGSKYDLQGKLICVILTVTKTT